MPACVHLTATQAERRAGEFAKKKHIIKNSGALIVVTDVNIKDPEMPLKAGTKIAASSVLAQLSHC